MKSRNLFFLIILLSLCMSVFAQPHVVMGSLRNSDGDYPNPDCVVFQAWIADRPGEILNQESDGCDVADTLWFVNVGSFETSPLDGDELIIHFTDTCMAETVTVSGILDLPSAEDYWGVIWLVPEGLEITVDRPNGGEEYIWGDNIPINWSTLGPVEYVDIEYSSDGGFSWNDVVLNTLDDGYTSWSPPDITSDEMLIKITDSDHPGIFDISDAFFSIGPGPSIDLTRPDGGEEFIWDEIENINWTASGSIANIKIEYSDDGGSSWETVIGSTPNDGSYGWTVPSVNTDLALVRISDVADPGVFDVSGDFFTIIEPAGLTIDYPNGGEEFVVGEDETITWIAVGGIGSLELHLSRDDGASWDLLASGLAGRGTFDWTVTGPPSDDCLVRIRDEADPSIFDISDAVFSIDTLPAEVDTVPPGAITDLEVLEVESDRAHLGWSSPGDDEFVGTAAIYTMGYEEFAFDWPPSNFVAGMPVPAVAGTDQEVWINGLEPETEYWVAMVTEDEVPNVSDVSNMVSFVTPAAPDTIAPAAFEIDTIIARDVSWGEFTIGWDAPGDDGNVGTADHYDFRFADEIIDVANFDISPILADVPVPLPAGTAQTLTVDGLSPETDYWIAGRAIDEVGNIGEISNVLMITTHEYTDDIRPGTIIDLTCDDTDPTTIELTFTAPGDDGDFGGMPGVGYEVRYRPEDPFDFGDWSLIPIYPDTFGAEEPGTEVTLLIEGLIPGTEYFFVIRTIDDDGPTSQPSNVTSCWTLGAMEPIPDLVMDEDDPDTNLPDLSGVFNPPMGLTYGVTSSEEGIHATLIDSEFVRISLEENYYGEGWVVIMATDGDDFLYDSIHVTVNPVNDQPVFITSPAESLILAGYPWEYMALAEDVDGDLVTYDLASGPFGMEVDISGYCDWLPGDIEGTYNIQIEAHDSVGEPAIQEFNLEVIKFTHPIFAPRNLAAWDGFRGCIPVHWEAPEAISRDLPVILSHYILWRSETYDAGYTIVADSVRYNSYCDNDVETGRLYFYKVQAVYREPEFNSGFSNIDGAASLMSKWLYSNYAGSKPSPFVDGLLEDDVWPIATEAELCVTTDLFLSNSDVQLFLALVNDGGMAPGYKIRFFFDDDNSETWDPDSGSSEGYYEYRYDTVTTDVYFHPINMTEIEPALVAEGARMAFAAPFTGEYNVEMSIDMNLETEFYALPGETVGVAFQLLSGSGDTLLNWPPDMEEMDPTTYAKLVIGAPGGLAQFFVNPPLLVVDLEEGWETDVPVTLQNTGDGTVVWNAEEIMDWMQLSSYSGAVPPGSDMEIIAHFETGLLDTGNYLGEVLFTTNDPLIPERTMNVDFTVTPKIPAHYLEVYTPEETTGDPGTMIEVPIYVGEVYDNEIFDIDFTVKTDGEFLNPTGVNRGPALPASWNLIVRNIYTDRVLVRLEGDEGLPAAGELFSIDYSVSSEVLAGRSSRIEIQDMLVNYGMYDLPIPVPLDGVFIVGGDIRYFWYGDIIYWDDGMARQDSIRIGLLDAATNDYDRGIDMPNLPPFYGYLDAHLLSEDYQELSRDIRPTGGRVIWTGYFEEDGFITWNPRQMWTGLTIEGWLDMTADSVYAVVAGEPVHFMFDATPGQYVWDVNIKRGWNLVSVPIRAGSMNISHLYPTAIGNAYHWNNVDVNYDEYTALDIGKAYWVLSDADTSYSITGEAVYHYDDCLPTGWNMIGSPAHYTYLADQSITPSDAFMIGTFYYYDLESGAPHYESTNEFVPGRGQWIYGRVPSSMRISSIYLPKPVVEKADPKIECELFMDSDPGQIVSVAISDMHMNYPAPPSVPGSMTRITLDGELPLRRSEVSSGGRTEWSGRIEVAKSDVLKWNMDGGSFTLFVDNVEIDMGEQGETVIPAGTHCFKLVNDNYLPEKLSIRSHPNPFNALSEFNFSLPEDGDVSIEIFDINGRHVRSLVDQKLEAGFHRVVWKGLTDQGKEAGSGIYLVMLKAGEQQVTRKVTLLK